MEKTINHCLLSFTEKKRDELRDQVYDAMAEKKEEKDKVEEGKMSVDGENAGAGEDKCDAVKEENKSEEDKGEPEKKDETENEEAGKDSNEEEEAAEGDGCYSPLKLCIFKP